MNERKVFLANIIVDNTPPHVTFVETPLSDNKSKAELRFGERVRPINGWEFSSNNLRLYKEFCNTVCYALPVIDLAENSTEVLVDIKNATYLSLEYGTYDMCSNQTLVTGGKISAPLTISSNSICKTEALFIRLSGNIAPNSLLGKAYAYTYKGENSFSVCLFAEQKYYYGYNPTDSTSWWRVGTDNWLTYDKKFFTEFGGVGMNRPSESHELASQYLFGLSGMQFKLENNPDFSIVYQGYVNGIGWLPASSDGEENLYQHDKPFSSLRINLVPKTEKQYLIQFWNRDIGTNAID